MRVRNILLILAAGAVALVGVGIVAGPSLKQFMMTKVVGSVPQEFFAPYEASAPILAEAAPGIWWYNTRYTRSLIADTGEGLVVIDCFNPEHARLMKAAIETELKSKVASTRIRALVYSHHHFDHIRGGAALAPEAIVADSDVAGHLSEGWEVAQILAPTVQLEDPAALKIGRLNVQAVDLGRGHGDRLWAFFFPEQKLLYAPDLAFVRTLPPFNLPDTNYVGLQRQFRAVLALPFERWVPSHFRISTDGRPFATRDDLVAYQGMMRDFQVWTREAFAKFGVPTDGAVTEAVFTYVQERAAAKYGNWDGYNSMSMPLSLQYISATYLGF